MQDLAAQNRLLNDVIFIWFTDKKPIHISHAEKSYNNRLYAPAATKKKDVGAKRFLRARMTFSKSLSACQNWTALV